MADLRVVPEEEPCGCCDPAGMERASCSCGCHVAAPLTEATFLKAGADILGRRHLEAAEES